MMVDELAEFWMHAVTVTPRTGTGSMGEVFGTPYTVQCFVSRKQRLVVGADAKQALATATIKAAPTIAIPPLGSKVTLPGGATTRVIAVAVHDGDALDLPSHVEVAVA